MEYTYNFYSLLGFSFNPIALQLGPISVTWYALAYILGLVFAWQYMIILAKSKFNVLTREVVESFFNYAILGVILGGRLGYVIFYNPIYYFNNPIEIFYIWNGGMSFHGGLVGVIIAQIIASKTYKIPLLAISDVTSLTAPIGIFLGRLANFINGELFGRTTEHPIGVIFPHGGNLPRHPSQLYEAIFEGLILFIILNILVQFSLIRKKFGLITGLFLIGYGMSRFIIEFFREPDSHIGLLLFSFSLGQWLCMPMIVFGIIITLIPLRIVKFS